MYMIVLDKTCFLCEWKICAPQQISGACVNLLVKILYAVTGRFAQCPVRPESFRTGSIRPVLLNILYCSMYALNS